MESSDTHWPRTVQLAIGLSIAGLFVGLINTFRLWELQQARFGFFYTLAQVAIPIIIFLGLLALVARRRNWARILLVTLFFLSVPGYALTLYGRPWGITEFVQLTNGSCFLASGILLSMRQSRTWFRRDASAT